MDHRAVFVQYFDEPAHMCSLKVVRQINRQRNRGHRILRGMRFVSDLDRESEIRNPDAVDSHFPMVGLILGIDEPG